MNCEKSYIGWCKHNKQDIYLYNYEITETSDEILYDFGYLESESGSCTISFNQIIPTESNSRNLVFDVHGFKVEIHLADNLQGHVLMELFREAYILQAVAKLYFYGHSGITGLDLHFKDPDKFAEINNQIKYVLNKIWNIVNEGNAHD